jgi:hypothetical protein
LKDRGIVVHKVYVTDRHGYAHLIGKSFWSHLSLPTKCTYEVMVSADGGALLTPLPEDVEQ